MFSAFLDTNSIYPLHLRDLLLDFAQSDFYKPLWSDYILEELARTLHVAYPQHADAHAEMIRLMCEIFPDALVTGFEPMVGSLGCKDPNDEHVLAGAIRSNSGALVTFNLRDFPDETFERFGIEIVTPDNFLLDLADLNERAACITVARRLDLYSKPSMKALEFASRLSKSNCGQFGLWVAERQNEIDSILETLQIARHGI